MEAGPSTWHPATYMEDQDGIPVSLPGPGPTLAVMPIWEVNYRSSLSFFPHIPPSPSQSAFQVKKSSERREEMLPDHHV